MFPVCFVTHVPGRTEVKAAAVLGSPNQSAGFGDRLWAEIQAAIALISDYPSIGEIVPRVRAQPTVRRVPLRHFPFLLVYRVYSDHIEVVALAHTSRKPRYWRGRST